jgi:hypothetical protein
MSGAQSHLKRAKAPSAGGQHARVTNVGAQA